MSLIDEATEVMGRAARWLDLRSPLAVLVDGYCDAEDGAWEAFLELDEP